MSGKWWLPSRRSNRRWMGVAALVVLFVMTAAVVSAQAPPGNTADTFIVQYRASRAAALAAFNNYARGLFRALALCEMAWVGVLLVLERSDLQGFTAGLLRKLLVLFFFFWLLNNGAGFSDAIINSFIQYGSTAAGAAMPVGGIGAGDIVWKGILVAENMVSSAGWSGFLFGPAGALAVMLSALIVVVAFGVIALQYIMAMVESIICVSAGLLFLGFGGNAVTRPYVERYFSLSVAVGVKLMVIYIIIGIGEALSSGWAASAAGLGALANPIRFVFDLMVGSLIYAVLAWNVPKFAASLLSGSPAFSGGDIISMGFNVTQAALLATGVGALAARGAAMAVGGGAARLAAASQVGSGGAAGASGAAGRSAPGGPGGPGPTGVGGSGGRGDGPSGGPPPAAAPGSNGGGGGGGSKTGSSSGPGQTSSANGSGGAPGSAQGAPGANGGGAASPPSRQQSSGPGPSLGRDGVGASAGPSPAPPPSAAAPPPVPVTAANAAGQGAGPGVSSSPPGKASDGAVALKSASSGGGQVSLPGAAQPEGAISPATEVVSGAGGAAETVGPAVAGPGSSAPPVGPPMTGQAAPGNGSGAPIQTSTVQAAGSGGGTVAVPPAVPQHGAGQGPAGQGSVAPGVPPNAQAVENGQAAAGPMTPTAAAATPGQGGPGQGSNRNQPPPPGAKWANAANAAKVAKHVEGVAALTHRAAFAAIQMSYYVQRILPHEGGGQGAPPTANMHGD